MQSETITITASLENHPSILPISTTFTAEIIEADPTTTPTPSTPTTPTDPSTDPATETATDCESTVMRFEPSIPDFLIVVGNELIQEH